MSGDKPEPADERPQLVPHSTLDGPVSARPSGMVVTYWHDDLAADDPVSIIERDDGTVFVGLSPHADPQRLTRALSLQLTTHLERSWVYVGDVGADVR